MNESAAANFRRLFALLRRYATLQLDYARLTATEKLAVLLSSIALCALAAVLGTATLLFISIALGSLLATTIAPYWAYLIVGGFYLLLLVLLVIFRHKLIFDPASRFITRLFLKSPDEQ